jgi:hypothetical protein
MRKATMSPEIAVTDAEVEADDIQVGNDGAERSGYPDALRGTGPVKACTDGKGGYCV